MDLINQITRGIIPVLSTPYTLDGEIDYSDLANQIAFEAASGVKALAIFGFASEFYKLADSEKKHMLETTISECHKHNLAVIASISDQSTEQAIKTATLYERMEADALMLLPPFTVPVPKTSQLRHISNVVTSVSIPMVIQYAPRETGISFSIDDITSICQNNENIVGIKLDGPDITATTRDISRVLDGRVSILTGYAGLQMIDTFAAGAKGVMPGASLTDLYVKIYKKYFEGDIDQAVSEHERLLVFLKRIFVSIESIVYWEKRVLKMRGVIKADYCRQPRYEPSEDEVVDFCSALVQLLSSSKINKLEL